MCVCVCIVGKIIKRVREKSGQQVQSNNVYNFVDLMRQETSIQDSFLDYCYLCTILLNPGCTCCCFNRCDLFTRSRETVMQTGKHNQSIKISIIVSLAILYQAYTMRHRQYTNYAKNNM